MILTANWIGRSVGDAITDLARFVQLRKSGGTLALRKITLQRTAAGEVEAGKELLPEDS